MYDVYLFDMLFMCVLIACLGMVLTHTTLMIRTKLTPGFTCWILFALVLSFINC